MTSYRNITPLDNSPGCLFHNKEFDDSVFFDGVNLLQIGFRKMLMEIKTEDLGSFLDLLRHIVDAEEVWSYPGTGSVMVKTPVQGLSILLLRPEAERLKHMLEISGNELVKFTNIY